MIAADTPVDKTVTVFWELYILWLQGLMIWAGWDIRLIDWQIVG